MLALTPDFDALTLDCEFMLAEVRPAVADVDEVEDMFTGAFAG